MVLIFVVVLVLFGGQKLPEFARGLGKSIREFKKAAAGVEEEFKRALEEDERKSVTPKLTAPAASASSPTGYEHSPGPDAGIPTYDEYGNEVYPEQQPETTGEVSPADPLPIIADVSPAAGTDGPPPESDDPSIKKPAPPTDPAVNPAPQAANPGTP